MTRVAFKMKLKPGMIEEYRRRHKFIWPELKELLKKYGISEYCIFFDEESESLFAVQKVAGAKSSQDLGKEEVVKKWWMFMAEIMHVNEDNSPLTLLLDEVFYME